MPTVVEPRKSLGAASPAMHRFPPVDELRYLVGTTLAQITEDPYQVSFLLTNDRGGTTLTSEYAFEFRQSNGHAEVHRPEQKSSNFGPCQFHKLLDDIVVGVELSADELQLCLSFAGGSNLTILSDLGGHEAGTIACGFGSQKHWVF